MIEGLEMDNATVLQQLDAMINKRLFGSGTWLADTEASVALIQGLSDLGLIEHLPDESFKVTPLGRRLELDLVMVFIGVLWEGHVPYVLEEYELIDEVEASIIHDRFWSGETSESLLLPVVKKAYFHHLNPNGIVN